MAQNISFYLLVCALSDDRVKDDSSWEDGEL